MRVTRGRAGGTGRARRAHGAWRRNGGEHQRGSNPSTLQLPNSSESLRTPFHSKMSVPPLLLPTLGSRCHFHHNGSKMGQWVNLSRPGFRRCRHVIGVCSFPSISSSPSLNILDCDFYPEAKEVTLSVVFSGCIAVAVRQCNRTHRTFNTCPISFDIFFLK